MRAPSLLLRHGRIAGLVLAAVFAALPATEAAAPTRPPHPVPAARCDGGFTDGSRINPAAPVNLTDVPGKQTVCDFYTFAWNQFLVFTQMSADPNNGKQVTPLFLHLAPWYNLLKVPSAPAPGPFPGGNTGLSTAHVDFGQAGTQDHLVDVDGATVLYDIRFNKQMYDFVRNENTTGHPPSGLFNSTAYASNCNPDASGNCRNPLWLPPSGGDPVGKIQGSLEVKSSWRDFGAPANCPASFYCNGRFGLAGIHLVQKTTTHGEWIWMSFEHVANTPDCAPGGDEPIAPTSPLGTPWSFFDPAKAGSGVMGSKTCSVAAGSARCNLNPKPLGAPKYMQVNICRTDMIPGGGASAANCTAYTGKPPTDNLAANIACLNAILRAKASGVWKNYKLIGSLWTKPGATVQSAFLVQIFQCTTPSPTCLTPIGQVHMANTTMETWTQAGATGYDPFGTNATQAGCFLCHNLPSEGSNGFSANTSADDLSHFVGKLPPAKIAALLKSLVPATSKAPRQN